MADNPNWKTILDALPESLHEIVKPVLIQWDQGVNAKLESVRKEYEGFEAYKEFVEQGIDPQYVMQSVQLADAIREKPDEMVDRISQTYNLNYAKVDPNASVDSDDDEDYDMTGDITKHPVVQQLTQALEELKGQVNEVTTEKQQEQQAVEYENYMKTLHDEHGAFDDIFVGAYLANGYKPDEAIEAYRQAIAQGLTPPTTEGDDNNNEQQSQGAENNGTNSPPVILDGNGAGSGTEQQTVNFGDMKKSDVMDLAEKFLQNAANQ